MSAAYSAAVRWRDEFGDMPPSSTAGRSSEGGARLPAKMMMERLQLSSSSTLNGPLEFTSLRGRMRVRVYHRGDHLPSECVSVHARVLTSRRMDSSSSQLDSAVEFLDGARVHEWLTQYREKACALLEALAKQ